MTYDQIQLYLKNTKNKLFLNDTTSISIGTRTRVYRYTRVHVADAILKDTYTYIYYQVPACIMYHHFKRFFKKETEDIFFLKVERGQYTLYCTTGRVLWCTMLHCVYTVSTPTPILQGIHTHNIYMFVCVHVCTSSVSYLTGIFKNFT